MERFGQMDEQTGRALSALSDLAVRDRKMEVWDGRRNLSELREGIDIGTKTH